jgi:hypothetical protein
VTAGFSVSRSQFKSRAVIRGTWNYPLEMAITSRVATNAVYAANFLPATASIASFDTALNLGDQQNNTCISMQAPCG